MPPTEDTSTDLETTLREFHEELVKIDEPSARSKELIAQVRADLDRIDTASLKDVSSKEGHEHGEGLLERIEDAAVEFSTEHPVLAGSLRRVAHFLSGAGV